MSADPLSTVNPSPSTASQKYVPRFKRDASAIPTVLAIHNRSEIQAILPGDDHTFVRAKAALPTAPGNMVPSQGDDNTDCTAVSETFQAVTESPSQGEAAFNLSDEFCRVMIHRYAHLSPPKELWTRNNIKQLDANIGRPLPVFQEAHGGKFEYLGWYRITKWERCHGKSTPVRRFIERRKLSQRERPMEYWAAALGEDWARVELERVLDHSLTNPMIS